MQQDVVRQADKDLDLEQRLCFFLFFFSLRGLHRDTEVKTEVGM